VEGLVLAWRELLIGVIAVLAVCTTAVVLRLPGRRAGWRRASNPSAAQRQINNLSLEIADLRRQLGQVQADLDRLKAASVKPVSPYNQAIEMAREGRSAAEVAGGCGISRGEAELIVALYRKLRI
jgi:type II secretory pathway pseudopilin PulG